MPPMINILDGEFGYAQPELDIVLGAHRHACKGP